MNSRPFLTRALRGMPLLLCGTAIGLPQGRPDLYSHSMSISRTTLSAGSVVSMAGFVRNGGTLVTGNFFSAFYFSRDSEITPQDTQLGFDIGPGWLSPGFQFRNWLDNHRLPSSLDNLPYGYYWIGLYGNKYHARWDIPESTYSNNGDAKVRILWETPPDYVVSSLTASPTTLLRGRNATATARITNLQGTIGNRSVYTELWLSPSTSPGGFFLGRFGPVQLGHAGNATHAPSFTVPASAPLGTCYIVAKVDPTNLAAERNESNNIASTRVTCADPLPDFTPTELAPSVSFARPGQDLSVTTTVRNAGAAAAPSSNAICVLSLDDKIDANDVPLANLTVAALASSQSHRQSFRITLPKSLPRGRCWLGLIADPGNAVRESDESNNTFAREITCIDVDSSVLIVDAAKGPGYDYSDLPEAVTAARNGQTILVRAGSYSPFQVAGKALTILGESSARIAVSNGNGVRISGIPANQRFVIDSLALAPVFPTNTPPVSLVDNQGWVVISDVELDMNASSLPLFLPPTLLVQSCARTVLNDCDLIGAPALRATGASTRVFVNGGRFRGVPARQGANVFAASEAIRIEDGDAVLTGVSVFGGDGLASA